MRVTLTLTNRAEPRRPRRQSAAGRDRRREHADFVLRPPTVPRRARHDAERRPVGTAASWRVRVAVRTVQSARGTADGRGCSGILGAPCGQRRTR